MTPEERSLSERAAAALEQLKPVAKEVHDAAENLAKPVATVESALSRMHIAFEAWVTYKHAPHEELYTDWDIGYTRIGSRWGVALRIYHGDETDPERYRIEQWFFNESPLYLRHRAIDKLPDLLEALAKTGANVAKKLVVAATKATEVAQTIAPATMTIRRVKR